MRIEFVHQDPEIAATVVNLFAQCFRDYQLGRSTERSIQDIAKLETEVQEQQGKVSTLEQQAVQYKRKFRGLGLDNNENILLQELALVKKRLIEKKDGYSVMQLRWQQILAFEKTGEPVFSLLDLSSISSSPHVSSLMTRFSQRKEEVGLLQSRYRNKHPRICLLYTSPSPRDRQKSRMPSSA